MLSLCDRMDLLFFEGGFTFEGLGADALKIAGGGGGEADGMGAGVGAEVAEWAEG